MKTKANKRWRLQIRFKDNNDPHWFRTWDMMEDFKQLIICKKIAIQLIDDTVSKARIVDLITQETIDLK